MMFPLSRLQRSFLADGGDSLRDVQRRDHGTFNLYNALLLRRSSGDSENYEIATTSLRLPSVVCKPLSILELAWMVAMATASPKVATIAALSQLVDHHRVLKLIHPFVNRIDFSDVKRSQVGPVHQSVREFVQIHHPSEEHSCKCFSSGGETSCTSGGACVELLEASMLRVCLRCLALDDIGCNSLFSTHQMTIDELPEETYLFAEPTGPAETSDCSWEDWESSMIQYDPAERDFGECFVYASSHWLEHYEKIEDISLVNLASVEKVCEASSVRLSNWIEQNRRPGCALKPRFELENSLYDPAQHNVAVRI